MTRRRLATTLLAAVPLGVQNSYMSTSQAGPSGGDPITGPNDRGTRRSSRMLVERSVLWAFAVVLTLLIGGINLVVEAQVRAGGPSGRIALAVIWIFPALVIGLACYRTAAVCKLRSSAFEQDGPASLGSVLSGVPHVPAFVQKARGLEVRLECRKFVEIRKGAGPGLNTVIVCWSDPATLDPAGLSPSPLGAAIPIVFDLPVPGPGADVEASGGPLGAVSWALQLLGDLPGLEGFAEFPIDMLPVAVGATPAGERRRMPRLFRQARPARSRIRVRPLSGGTLYLLPVIPPVAWVLPPLLTIAVISLPSRIEVRGEELRIRTGVRILGQWDVVRRREVRDVRLRVGTGKTVKYSVLVRTEDADRVAAANLDGLGDAEWLVAELNRWRGDGGPARE